MARCLVVQHALAERPFLITDALGAEGVRIETRTMWTGGTLPPSLAGWDGLVVMGGPMSARSGDRFPWREAEMGLLREAIEHEVPVLGVCLGAQLLAAAAGGRVVPGDSGPEVGWGPVRLGAAARTDPLLGGWPENVSVLHWHGETVELPPGAVVLAGNDRYRHQAFRVGPRAWGVQFHMEVDEGAVEDFLAAFAEEAAATPGGAEGIRAGTAAALAALGPLRRTALHRFAALVAAESSPDPTPQDAGDRRLRT